MSGSQQSLLREAAICIVERWKKSICMGYRFVPKCNYADESHKCPFFALNLPYLQDHGFLRSRRSILFDCPTQSNDWSSIGFDWFFVRFCSIG